MTECYSEIACLCQTAFSAFFFYFFFSLFFYSPFSYSKKCSTEVLGDHLHLFYHLWTCVQEWSLCSEFTTTKRFMLLHQEETLTGLYRECTWNHSAHTLLFQYCSNQTLFLSYTLCISRQYQTGNKSDWEFQNLKIIDNDLIFLIFQQTYLHTEVKCIAIHFI